MTYTISLQLHEDILDGSKESALVVYDLALKAVEAQKWAIEQSLSNMWFGWQELDGTFKAELYTDELWHKITDLYEEKKIKEYAGPIEAPNHKEALLKTQEIIEL